MLFVLLGVLVVLLVVGGVTDFRARRRRARLRRVDAQAVRGRRYDVDAAEAQMRSRISNGGDNTNTFGGQSF